MVRRLLGTVIVLVLVVLVWRVIWRYTAENVAGHGELGAAIMHGVEDVTYRWLATAATWIGSQLAQLPGLVFGR